MIINAVVSVYWATHLFLKVMRPVNASGRIYQQFFHQYAMKYIESNAHRYNGITIWFDFWAWFQRWQHHKFEGRRFLSPQYLEMRTAALRCASLSRYLYVWAFKKKYKKNACWLFGCSWCKYEGDRNDRSRRICLLRAWNVLIAVWHGKSSFRKLCIIWIKESLPAASVEVRAYWCGICLACLRASVHFYGSHLSTIDAFGSKCKLIERVALFTFLQSSAVVAFHWRRSEFPSPGFYFTSLS